MTPKRETLKEKAARGEYALIEPVDYLILGNVPEEGQLAFGLYPLGETTINLKKKFTPDQQKGLTGEVLAGRLRVLRDQGLVKMVAVGIGTGGKKVWQRTKTGSLILNKWKGANGGGSGGGSRA